jgi:GNAT superfamily N-acetyltransferase
MWSAEEAAINGFPPLRQVVFDGWLLRFSRGVRRTANSVTPLHEPHAAIDALVATAEALYGTRGQPTIFRIPSFVDPEIDRRLAACGYSEEGESCVIAGPLEPIAAASDREDGIALSPRPTRDWLAGMATLQGQSAQFHAVYRRIVSSVALPAAYAEITIEGEPVALAYGIIHRGMLCYESVVTGAQHRRQGHSRRVLAALARWAKDNGATMATLQVEAPNTPARALYHSIGMTTELHRYHYRREPG